MTEISRSGRQAAKKACFLVRSKEEDSINDEGKRIGAGVKKNENEREVEGERMRGRGSEEAEHEEEEEEEEGT